MQKIEGVYLLHFTKPYRGCSHYIGWSNDIYRRYQEHVSLNGKSNPLVKAAIENDSVVLLVRVWEGESKKFERWLKNKKGASKLCPCCYANWMKNGKSLLESYSAGFEAGAKLRKVIMKECEPVDLENYSWG